MNSDAQTQSKPLPFYYLLLLILAGEAVFILPFVLARVFRPTVLEAFQLTNLELGLCYSVYGLVALPAYLLGGPLADRFPPRKLIAVALWATALGGLVYASYPSLLTLKILYGYWGLTTIFLFWAAMIKATRVWGGAKSQGKAFGFLDGGRGLVGAGFGLLGVLIFSLFAAGDLENISIEERKEAFKYVIWVSSSIVILIGILVWFFLKSDRNEKNLLIERISKKDINALLRIPSVWLLMVIILCAYVGYKFTDIFSQYANEIMGYNEVDSAKVGTFLLSIRPITGVLIGFIADRSRVTLWLVISFALSIVGALLFALGWVTPSGTAMFFLSVLITASGIYAARALYFATMKEGRIPLVLTGTAVGLISLVGYTPDIFAGAVMGYLLDQTPGLGGHQNVFWTLSCFSVVGGIASFIFWRWSRKGQKM
ncbi:MFS transporter [Aureisphaera galaxeae]|uniref:MFS transporter n=1 Tax=Aureisphaera galaxeae TaxID=1538023 RepID=UPI0023507649|nr:MFS transporter [Aureisphaera galaxeae]MDC8004871.1 MFS transporter [Aureisphaera galaxeae]